jgi:hypothetical protein
VDELIPRVLHTTAAPTAPRHVGFSAGTVGVAPAGHARGSHGSSPAVAAFGVAMAPDAPEGAVVVVVGTVAPADVLGLTDVAAGGLTANWVPVTTVT